MLKEAVEKQRAMQGSEFNYLLSRFRDMKPKEQNSLIYSFNDLVRRMQRIQYEQESKRKGINNE